MRLINCLRICSFVNRLYLERALLTEIWMCGALRRDGAQCVIEMLWRFDLAVCFVLLVVKLVGGDTLGPPLLPAFLICYDFNQIWKFVMYIKVNMKCFSWAPLPYQPWRSRLSLMRGWESGFLPPRRQRLTERRRLEASLHVLEMTQINIHYLN